MGGAAHIEALLAADRLCPPYHFKERRKPGTRLRSQMSASEETGPGILAPAASIYPRDWARLLQSSAARCM